MMMSRLSILVEVLPNRASGLLLKSTAASVLVGIIDRRVFAALQSRPTEGLLLRDFRLIVSILRTKVLLLLEIISRIVVERSVVVLKVGVVDGLHLLRWAALLLLNVELYILEVLVAIIALFALCALLLSKHWRILFGQSLGWHCLRGIRPRISIPFPSHLYACLCWKHDVEPHFVSQLCTQVHGWWALQLGVGVEERLAYSVNLRHDLVRFGRYSGDLLTTREWEIGLGPGLGHKRVRGREVLHFPKVGLGILKIWWSIGETL